MSLSSTSTSLLTRPGMETQWLLWASCSGGRQPCQWKKKFLVVYNHRTFLVERDATRIIKSISWFCTGQPKNPTMCLRGFSKCSVTSCRLVLWPLPSGACSSFQWRTYSIQSENSLWHHLRLFPLYLLYYHLLLERRDQQPPFSHHLSGNSSDIPFSPCWIPSAPSAVACQTYSLGLHLCPGPAATLLLLQGWSSVCSTAGGCYDPRAGLVTWACWTSDHWSEPINLACPEPPAEPSCPPGHQHSQPA